MATRLVVQQVRDHLVVSHDLVGDISRSKEKCSPMRRLSALPSDGMLWRRTGPFKLSGEAGRV